MILAQVGDSLVPAEKACEEQTQSDTNPVPACITQINGGFDVGACLTFDIDENEIRIILMTCTPVQILLKSADVPSTSLQTDKITTSKLPPEAEQPLTDPQAPTA